MTASCNAVQPVFWEEVVQVGGGGRKRERKEDDNDNDNEGDVTIKSEAPR